MQALLRSHDVRKRKGSKVLYELYQFLGPDDARFFEKVANATIPKEAGDLLSKCFQRNLISEKGGDQKDNDSMTIDQLMGSLQAHEEKFVKRRGKEPLKQAFYSKVSFKEREKSFLHRKEQGRGRGHFCGHGGFHGRGRGKGRENYNKEDDNQWSSYKRGCRRGFQSQRGVEEKVNLVEVQDEDELTLLMARHDEQEERIKPWHIASNHMTGEEDLFMEMKQSKGNLTFGDESKAPVKGKGKILIRVKDHARSSFLKKATSRAKEPLQLIHTDLCGPITPPSQAFKAFKKFKAMFENEKGLKIKYIRSDRGGEFLSTEFNKFCKDNGIRRSLMALYSPQQYGVVERKNRTILNMVRSMLKSKKMPKDFWAEAVDCAVYLLNRCPSTSLDNKTPQEAWNGLKPTISHLQVFGSITYVHVSSQRRSKLDDRSEKHVFVGYDKQSKGYKLCNPVTRKVVVSEEVQQPKSSTPTPTQDSPLSSSKGEPKTRSLQELYESIEKNDTWELTTLPKGQKAIGVKWVHKSKKKSQRRSREVQGKTHGKRWKIQQMDVKSAIDLANNHVYHARSKHINTRYYFIRECIARKDVRVIHTSSKNQVMDIFIKPLNKRDFSRQRMMFRVGKSSLKGGVGS
ncbi:retrovirus-related pol polyprotein from transposon TNT 1-94 [Tanacetum coccineum]